MSWVLGALILYLVWKWFSLVIFPKIIRRWFSLEHRMTTEEGYLAVPDRTCLIGSHGTAQTDLRPCGKALLGQERLDVATRGEFLPRGTPIRVVEVQGGNLVVAALADPGEPPTA